MRLTIDINGVENNFRYTNFNLSIIGGVGVHPFEASFVYPSLHTGVMLYSRGDNGSSYQDKFWDSFQVELLLDATLTSGFWRNNVNHNLRTVPLYHFSDILPNPLVNPFQHSLGLGINWIYSFDDYKQCDRIQKIGFGNILIDRHFQFNMYNDGTPYRQLGLTDKHDRYYTGGGQFSYHTDNNYFFDTIELSFMKYTGFDYSAFETANLLQLDFIPHKRAETTFYNKNRLRLRLGNSTDNYSLHITAHNTDKDFQDFIHYKGDYALECLVLLVRF